MSVANTVVVLLFLSVVYKTNCRDIEYYIAAVEDTWDYASSGQNLITVDTSSQTYLSRFNGSIGHVYKKALFREFTNGTFTTEKSRPDYLGLIGPVITANVGDRITIHFKNKASREYFIQPLALTHANEGERGRGVNPGETRDIVWKVDAACGPRDEDPVCITSLYYSNVDLVKDVNSGLVGIMKICRTGTSSETQRKHFAVYLNAVDENKSWYLDDNIGRYSDSTDSPDDLKRRSNFIESNRKHSINGYIYGNIPPLSVCLNDDVYLHVASLGGNSNDVHSFTVLGHTLLHKNKRVDAVPIYPGVTSTVTLRATEVGSWLLGSRAKDHWEGGMLGLMTVNTCNNRPDYIRVSGKIKRYYIAAERIYDHRHFYYKTVFNQYTNRKFTTLKQRSADDAYLRTLGPLITANQGDIIKVVFYNKGSKPHSIYPRGVRMTKHYEGIFYNDTAPVPRTVLPGRRKTYYWTVPESFAPRNNDSLCRMTYYTSEVNEDSVNGLVGPMLICKEGTLFESGYPVGKAKDMFLIYTEGDNSEGSDFNINGVQTPPTIQLCHNEEIDLHLLYIGYTEPFITLHFDQDPVLLRNTKRTTIGITSHIQETVTFVTKRQGEIVMNGNKLSVHYTNVGCGVEEESEPSYPLSKTLYFGIVEQQWNYVDGNRTQDEWLSLYPGSVGPNYKKVAYKSFYTQYTLYAYPSTNPYIGPLIKVAVGSSIKIVLRNKGKIPFTLHADGIIIEVENRPDNETAVGENEAITFIWKFPESSGPADGDQNCIMRIYYSNINKTRDVRSGLVGPLLVCRDSSTADTNSVIFLGGTDETQSWFIDENLSGKTTDSNYRDGNNIYAINGYADGTFPHMDQIIPQSERYIHVANIDTLFHTFHLNGNYFNDTRLSDGANVIGLYPWTTTTMKVKMQNDGRWTLQGLGNEDQIHNLYGTYFVGTKVITPEK